MRFANTHVRPELVTVLVALASLLIALAIYGMASRPSSRMGDAFVGTWEIVGLADGASVTAEEEFTSIRDLGLNVTLLVSGDGSMGLNLFGEMVEGEWRATSAVEAQGSLEGDSVVLTLDESGELTLDQGAQQITFRRRSA